MIMLMIGPAKSADIIHYLRGTMLAQNAEALGRSKMLQIVKIPLTILDILFPETIIKVVKQLSQCSTNNLNPTIKEES